MLKQGALADWTVTTGLVEAAEVEPETEEVVVKVLMSTGLTVTV